MAEPLDLDAIRERLRWHEYHHWADPGPGARWWNGDPVNRPPFPEACGDCGKHPDTHPTPWLPVDGEETGRLLLEADAARARVAELEDAIRLALDNLAWMTRPGGKAGVLNAARRCLTDALAGTGQAFDRHGNAASVGGGQNESGPEAVERSPRTLGPTDTHTARRTQVDDTATPADPAHAGSDTTGGGRA